VVVVVLHLLLVRPKWLALFPFCDDPPPGPMGLLSSSSMIWPFPDADAFWPFVFFLPPVDSLPSPGHQLFCYDGVAVFRQGCAFFLAATPQAKADEAPESLVRGGRLSVPRNQLASSLCFSFVNPNRSL